MSTENKAVVTAMTDVSLEVDEQAQRREEMVAAGVIEDPRVFQLMYLEECNKTASLSVHITRTSYTERVQALQREMISNIRELEVGQQNNLRRIADIRREMEEDYGIQFVEWGHDNGVGVLTKTAPEELARLDEEAEGGKLKEDTNNEASSDKGSVA